MQQVDLYQPVFRSETSWTSSSGMLMATGAFAALLMLLFGQSAVSTWLKQRDVVGLTAQKSEQVTRLKDLKSQAADPGEGKVLEAEIERLVQALRAKERLAEVLSPGVVGNTDGFSSVMAALARQRIEGVWLRAIKIANGGHNLSLIGSTLNPAAVPDLLEMLGKEPSFTGREFRSFRLERSKSEISAVNFLLSTHRTDS